MKSFSSSELNLTATAGQPSHVALPPLPVTGPKPQTEDSRSAPRALSSFMILGLHGEKPVPILLPNTVPHFDPAADERRTEVECQANLIWYHGLKQIPPSERPRRAGYLLSAIFRWSESARKEQTQATRAYLSLALFINDGLNRDLCHADGESWGGDETDFIRKLLGELGLGYSNSRISHGVAAANIWLMLCDAGLPTPAALGRLECLTACDHVSILAGYKKIVDANNQGLPNYHQLTALAIELAAQHPTAKQRSRQAKPAASIAHRTKASVPREWLNQMECQGRALAATVAEKKNELIPIVGEEFVRGFLGFMTKFNEQHAAATAPKLPPENPAAPL
jgi:hypothetical protein